MDIQPLRIHGSWTVTPRSFPDERGSFQEVFSGPAFVSAVGHPLTLGQANLSVSHAGVLRGVHYADVPPGQAKYVTCTAGAVWDVVVDVRTGSPTYGQWEAVLLDDADRRAVYLSEGLGHAFLSLTPASTVMYLCSTPYAPTREHGLDPFDPALGIQWPTTDRDGNPLELTVSAKDREAPTLEAARAGGVLPDFATCQRWTSSLTG